MVKNWRAACQVRGDQKKEVKRQKSLQGGSWESLKQRPRSKTTTKKEQKSSHRKDG